MPLPFLRMASACRSEVAVAMHLLGDPALLAMVIARLMQDVSTRVAL